MGYILIVDDEEDICDILQMRLSANFGTEVLVAPSGNEALKIIKQQGTPDLIISDYRMPDGDGVYLHQSLKAIDIKSPFIVCSGNSADELKKLFPDAYGYVEKPRILDPILKLVDKLIASPATLPTYIPVRISFLLRLGQINFDLHMSLNEEKHVKVFNAGEVFLKEDAERFYQKGLNSLLMKKKDSEQLLKAFETNLQSIGNHESGSKESLQLSMESLEIVERLARSFGWTPQVLELANKTVQVAITSVSRSPDVLSLLKARLHNPTSAYSQHISLQSMLTCLFCYQLGWTSESTQLKLALASLMHDLTVEENVYDNVEAWNKRAMDSADKSPATIKYRNHPVEAVSLLQSIPNVPSDVDQIILLHHERRDGTGFPRKVNGSRINPLATLFIITEDLVNYLGDGEQLELKLSEFFTSSDYSSGNFRKVFEGLKERLVLVAT